MKVIDLLNMISKGEELPNKIKYEGITWKLNKMNNTYDDGTRCFFEDYIDKNYVITDVLNDEVEVIEDKKIKRLDLDWIDVFEFKEQAQQDCVKMIFSKINEIIGKLEN